MSVKVTDETRNFIFHRLKGEDKKVLDRSMLNHLEKDINLIERHFETNGINIYNQDPDLLIKWHDIVSAFEKYYIKIGNALPLIRDTVIIDDHGKEAYQYAILRIGGFVNGEIYRLIIYDRNIKNKWHEVANYLENFTK